MCTGKFVRFWCPEALNRNPLCPHYDAVNGRIRGYAQLWVQTKFVCCGNHRGDCTGCPDLYRNGNTEYQDAYALECDDCATRRREERISEVAEMVGLDERENSVAPSENAGLAAADSENSSCSSYSSDSYTASVDVEMEDADAQAEVSGSREVSHVDVVVEIEAHENMDVELELECYCANCRNEQ